LHFYTSRYFWNLAIDTKAKTTKNQALVIIHPKDPCPLIVYKKLDSSPSAEETVASFWQPGGVPLILEKIQLLA
jgi:hypothetical protein